MSLLPPLEDPNLRRRISKLEARRVNLRYWLALSGNEIQQEQCRILLQETEAELDILLGGSEVGDD